MALIKCRECGSEVSSKAASCPKCGVSVARKGISISGILSAGLAVFLLYSCGSVLVSINGGGSKKVVAAAPAQSVASLPVEKSDCNKESSQKVKDNLALISTVDYSGQRVELRLQAGVMDGVEPAKARSVLEAFANADACLSGSSREIRYYRNGKLWAVMSPSSGFFWA